ncbi:hypothetical protein IGG_03211, partial [Bacillus cereus HuB13-1]
QRVDILSLLQYKSWSIELDGAPYEVKVSRTV